MTNGLVIVAHYDDPLIWAGGAIRRTAARGWNWTIVATCVEVGGRKRYFEQWCGTLGVQGIDFAYADHPDGRPFSRNDRRAMTKAVFDALQSTRFDWVFTHNAGAEGEYGFHPNHAEAAEIVTSLVDAGLIVDRQIVHFCYRRAYGLLDLPAVGGARASHVLPLDYRELAWKAKWCERARDVEIRDPLLAGFTWLDRLSWPCPNPEAFDGCGSLPPPFVPTKARTSPRS